MRRKPIADSAAHTAPRPRATPAKVSGWGNINARNGIWAKWNRVSPITPPSPVLRGHEAGTGHAAKQAADKGTEMAPSSQRFIEGAPIKTVRIAPPIISARPDVQLDQPSA